MTDSSRSTGSTPHAEFLQRTIAFGRRLFIPRSPVATPHWRRGPERHSQAHGASQTDASRSRGSLSPAGLGPLTRPLPLCRPTACVVLTTVPAGHPRRLAPVPWALPMPGWAWANAVQLTWRVPAAAGRPACRDQCPLGGTRTSAPRFVPNLVQDPDLQGASEQLEWQEDVPSQGTMARRLTTAGGAGAGGGEAPAAVAYPPSLCGLASTQSPQSGSGDGPNVLASSDSCARTDFPCHTAGRG